MTDTVSIIGAGLSGSLLAAGLAHKGYKVTVYEMRSDMRTTRVEAGRSINLALSHRGFRALEAIGLEKTLKAQAIPMQGRSIHLPESDPFLMPYSPREHEVIYSVSRSGLNEVLMTAAEEAGAVIHFDSPCHEVDLETGKACVGSDKRWIEQDLLIGADGAPSAVRSAFESRPEFTVSLDMLDYGYKELAIPPLKDGSHRIEKEALHIWPRNDFMLIALPNLDGSFTCTLFLPFAGPEGFETLTSGDSLRDFFKTHFPDTESLIPDLEKDFFSNPTGKLGTIRCYPWSLGNNVLLLGDAAHAIVPFYGQGMNCAFEDCRLLLEQIPAQSPEWPTILRSYQESRKEDTDAIARLALDNFIEMRDSVANPQFAKKRSLEQKLELAFPDVFTSKYCMVTFHDTPYREALARGRAQDDVLMAIVARTPDINTLNLEEVMKQVQKALP